jgi:hypothetical protein
MCRDDMTLSLAMVMIIKRGDVDKQSRAWSKIYRYKGKMMDLITRMISNEIANTEQEGTLFRNNNFCIGLISQFSQDIARPYLKQTLAPLVRFFWRVFLGLQTAHLSHCFVDRLHFNLWP